MFTPVFSSAGRSIALLLLLLLPLLGRAQTNISSTVPFTQNFNGIGNSGTASLSTTGFKVSKSATERTVTLYSSAATATERQGGATLSGTAANGIYNFGDGTTAAGGTDRAIGGLSSGSASKSVNLNLQLTNSDPAAINSFTISYNVEKYRTGINPAGYSIQLYYSTDDVTYVSAGSAFLTSFPADATTAGYTTAPGASVSVSNQTLTLPTPLAPNAKLYFAWNYSVTSGTTTSNAQALAIDDIIIGATAAPAAPEINAQQAGADVLTGDTFTGFANTNVGSTSDVIFTIQNTGSAALTVGAGTFDGDYALAPSSTLPTTVAAGASANFTVRFSPTASGTRTGSVSIVNDDSNENPYIMNFSGVGVSATPTIIVTNSPALTAFVTTVPALSAAQTYTVQVFSLSSAFIVTAPTGFEVSSDGTTYTSSLNLGTADATYTIRVRLTGAARGTFTGNVTNESTGANTPNDVAVSGTTIAGPATYYLVTSATDPSVPANFNTVANGTGTVLTGFDVENATLILTGPVALTPTFNVVLSGVNSKFILGDGTMPIALYLPAAGAEFTAKIDLSANTTLVVQDDTPTFTYGTVAATSTVDYAQAGTFTLPIFSFGNLKLTGGTKLFPATTTTVRGNLVADGVTDISGPLSLPFATIDLKGNFTLLNGTTFSSNAAGRITLLLSSGTTQTMTGNGNEFGLFRVTTTTAATKVVLATAGGSTNLALGNTGGGGGYTLATNTTLELNGNNVTFSNGNTTIGTGNGTLTATTGSNLTFNHAGNTALGTLRLGTGEQLASLTLNATGTGTGPVLTLPASFGTLLVGGLNLTAGTLVIGAGNTLRVDGPATATAAGLLQGSATSRLSFTGASTSTVALGFTTGAGRQLQALTLDQAASVITLGTDLTAAALNLTAGTLAIGGGTTLTLAGPVATTGGLLQGSATSNLNITGTITGTLAFTSGSGSELLALTLNQTTNSLIPVGSTLTIGTLNLTRGSLLFSGNNRAIVSTLSGGSSDSFLNALTLSTPANTTATVNYPLGANLNRYRPLTLKVVQNAATATAYTARVTAQNTNGRGVVGLITRVSARRFFTVTEETPGNFLNGTLTLSYGTGDGVTDLSTLRIALSLASNVAYVDVNPTGIPAAITTSTTIEDAIVALGDFAIATTSSDLTINPLPVALTRFGAQRQADNAVAVSWTTASEQNSASFEVQRSLDGRTFVTVATAAARGTSTQATNYAAQDNAAPAATSYYRLRQVDTDGKAVFSQVVTVAGTTPVAAPGTELTLYPNPTTDRITAALPAAEGRTYRVLNALGQVVSHGTAEAAHPSVEVRQLPAGLYFLELHTATGSQVRRFVKNN